MLERQYGSSVTRIRFKDKTFGWHRFATRIEFANGVRMIFENGRGHSTRFIGTEGWIEPPPVVYQVGGGAGSAIQAHPKTLLTSPIGPNDVHLGRARGGHGGDFIRAVKDRKPTTVGIDIAVRSDVILHLTDIAIRTGRKITWDPLSERIVDDECRWLLTLPDTLQPREHLCASQLRVLVVTKPNRLRDGVLEPH